MKFVHLIMFLLALIGGVNWLLIGFMGTDLFVLFGSGGVLTLVLYLLTTVSTLYVVFPTFMKHLQTV